jgi:hypothetical protein
VPRRGPYSPIWRRCSGRPTKNRHTVRKVSLLHPVAEERAVWSPKDAGLATRQVLDELACAFRRVLVKAKVRPRKLHALRHSFASAKVLLDTYSHWIKESVETATEAATSKQTSKQSMAAVQGRDTTERPGLALLTR